MQDQKLIGVTLVGIILLVGGLFFIVTRSDNKIEDQTVNETPKTVTTPKPDSTSTPQPMEINKSKKYTALLKTDRGDITVELFADKTPITVNNFVSLARKKFYDGTVFHRVIDDFMIQGGDPKGDGTGGPGYRFDDEPFEGEYTRGTIAMANAGPNTNGSQFFIMHADKPLPKNYVIFGKVIAGLDTVDKIATGEVKENQFGEASVPVSPSKVLSITIQEK